jgi:hypothetical protein
MVNTEECFAESAVVNAAGGVVRVPGKSHFIVHNILHHQVFNHCLDKDDTPLYQLIDLHVMRKRHDPEIDWARIRLLFNHPSIYDAFYYTLDLSRKYFGDDPPVPIPLLLPLRIRYRWLRVKMNKFLQFRRDRHA